MAELAGTILILLAGRNEPRLRVAVTIVNQVNSGTIARR
jgi:hypothetical protein